MWPPVIQHKERRGLWLSNGTQLKPNLEPRFETKKKCSVFVSFPNFSRLARRWFFFFFSSIWVFFHNHSQTIGLKGEGISLTPQSHFHPLHRHFDIRQAITAESSPLHIGSSRIGTGNLWFPSACRLSRVDLLYLCYLGLFWIRPHMCKKMSLKKTGFCN